MSKRGIYRGIYSALIDDPEFQTLPPAPRHLLLTMRLSKEAGLACVFRYYPTTLAVQTGYPVRRVHAALAQLKAAGWIDFDGAIMWIRNGLRFDPSVTLANQKHRTSIERWISELPKSPILARFCDYYKMAYPFDRVSDHFPELASRRRNKEEEGIGSRTQEKEQENNLPPADAGAGREAWTGYSEAYQRRYKTSPVRNAKVNSLLKQFVQRIPATEAAAVAAFYVSHNGAFYVRAGHSVDLLLRDAEKLHTEWVTGRRITETGARAGDQREDRGGMAHRLLEKSREQETPNAEA